MKQAIIIGAGPAGLSAAYRLLQASDGYEVHVLEASQAIGGISQTIEYNGNRMDLGGHRFFSKSEEVMDFWRNLLPVQGKSSTDDKILGIVKDWAEGGPDPEREERVILLRDRVSRIYYLRKFFDYPIQIKPQTFINMGLANTFSSGIGYLTSIVRKLPEDNLENFYINRFGRPLYNMFFEGYTEKVWGRHPSQISADWGAQRVKGLSLMKAIGTAIAKPFRKKDGDVETSLIEQFYYPKRGPGQLWEQLAREVEKLGATIHFGEEVTAVNIEQGKIKAVRSTTREWPADAIFSTMPVKDLVQAMGEAVPGDLQSIARELPYRDFMTVGLLLEELELPNESGIPTMHGGVPDNWIYIQERDVSLGRLQIFNNWSPYMVKDPKETTFIGLEYFCNEGDEQWNMSDEDFIAFAIRELAHIGIIKPDKVLDAVRIHVKKAYPAYFGTYSDFPQLQIYLNGIAGLYCIGRNGQHRYNNMDHSVLTAFRGVDALLGRCEKEAMWNVNTEKEYHEEDET